MVQLQIVLNEDLRKALNEGLIETNPVHETMLPEGKPPRETHAYDLAQISALLNHLTGPARAAVARSTKSATPKSF